MTTMRAPWLVLAVGNPSRGDDALGPMLLERLIEQLRDEAGDVEWLTDFQLQVEHALDLTGRQGVLFVDAAHPGTVAGATLAAIAADPRPPTASHALSPQALLRVAQQIGCTAPPAWLLAIEGQAFGLGEGLSASASRHLDAAAGLVRDWLHARRASTARETSHA